MTALHPNDIRKNILHLQVVERFQVAIAQSFVKLEKEADDCSITDVVENSSRINAKVNGHDVAVGNTKFMDSLGADWKLAIK